MRNSHSIVVTSYSQTCANVSSAYFSLLFTNFFVQIVNKQKTFMFNIEIISIAPDGMDEQFIYPLHSNPLQHNAERLLKLIDEVYRWLPLGTIVNNRVLVVHGGISDSTDLDLIRSLDRGKVSV